MTRLKLTAAAAFSALALLTGCATPLAGKPADEAARKVMALNWQNASYNFDGQFGFSQLRFADSGGKLGQPELADAIDQVGSSIKMNVSGAIDAPAGKLELIPELRFERRNLLASVKLPMQFRAQDMSLLVDPSAIDLAVPALRRNPGKFVRAKLPADIAARIPLKEMYQAMPQILDQAYGQLDKKAFSFEPLDAYADEVGAKYKLRLTLSKEQEQKMTLLILDGLAKAARQQVAQPNDKFDAESMLKLVRDLVKLSPAGELDGQTVSDVYVSRSGEMEAIRQTIHMASAEFSADAYFNLRYSHHGKPQFVYQPAENDIIDFNKLELPGWLAGKADAGEQPIADAAAPAPQPQQPAPSAAKSGKKKTKASAQ
ncbi:hypothetical protein [Chromobacterium sphagni]|uniref:Uncharacterized protein n=1 Tax=Chromobacterium sphagni TaxID=1903179 RepID=A0A1S1X4L6_9NEIS|nr:hypothetical protein [Chromobacterium sphagni]OHX14429.1 hypothetical protein BI347_13635 [Chromobacterium sphagni]OHX19811.1 hypothetical protein BI344_16605 [Chromobacterium sphagni]